MQSISKPWPVDTAIAWNSETVKPQFEALRPRFPNRESASETVLSGYVRQFSLPNSRYAFSTITGALDRISPKISDSIAGKLPVSSLDADEVNFLRQRGYLWRSSEEERDHLLKVFLSHSKRERDDMQMRICPTLSCNLRCTYCFEGKLVEQPVRALTTDEVGAAFAMMDREIVARYRAKRISIELFGGEPFLPQCKSAVEAVLNECEQRGWFVRAATNAINIPTFLPLLRRHSARLDVFRVTLDGPAHLHDTRRIFPTGRGSFERTVSGVDLLVEASIPVSLRVNLDKNNLAHLSDTIDFVKRKGWSENPAFSCSLALVVDHQCQGVPNLIMESESLAPLARALKANGPWLNVAPVRMVDQVLSLITGRATKPRFYYCNANASGGLVFGPGGLVYPCNEGVVGPEKAVGRYLPVAKFDAEYHDIWSDRSLFTLPECLNCSVMTICGGGCEHLRQAHCGKDLVRSRVLIANGLSCEEEVLGVLKAGLEIVDTALPPAQDACLATAGPA